MSTLDLDWAQKVGKTVKKIKRKDQDAGPTPTEIKT